ncbi:MAG: HD family phosphohydrolase, partial [bacterium]
QKIINEIFIDGQLDEANLTLKDLHRIARSFTHTLTGIFHHRIDYPQRPLTSPEKRDRKRKKENGAVSEQDSARGKPPEDARGSGAKDIKRLGQA